MSVYFIHAEVLDGGDVVTKVCATATTSNANEAFDWFLGCGLVAKYEIKGYDVIIDKLEKVK